LSLLTTLGFVLLTQPLLAERDMRLRTHASGLSRYYLDTLLGLLPLRTHGATRAMRREHESLLAEWARAAHSFYDIQTVVQGITALLSTGCAVAIVFRYLASGGGASGVLLLLYWTLNLPALGQQLAIQAQQYPTLRNSVLRVLEPLGAPEEPVGTAPGVTDDKSPAGLTNRQSTVVNPSGVAIQFDDVTVVAGGHTILQHVNLAIAPGEHVAIVGASGAGKSTLVGLLLGWHKPARGQVLVDGRPLTGKRLDALRRVTAWVDPAVQLWNRSLLDNLLYGTERAAMHTGGTPLGLALQQADLYDVVDRLPHGLQTVLGESGGLVSGGEGQRVRLGRAFLRPDARLAILDEPLRGLDRSQRRQLLDNARQWWRTATLLCVTHDVGETRGFDRVLVIEEGRIIEEGAPDALGARNGTRYHQLLRAEKTVRQYTWQGAEWQRLWLENGTVQVWTEPRDDLEQIRGIGPWTAQRLYAAGIQTFAALAQSTPEQLAAIARPDRRQSESGPRAWIEQAERLARRPSEMRG